MLRRPDRSAVRLASIGLLLLAACRRPSPESEEEHRKQGQVEARAFIERWTYRPSSTPPRPELPRVNGATLRELGAVNGRLAQALGPNLKVSCTFPPCLLAGADLDGDGRLDTAVQVRDTQGAGELGIAIVPASGPVVLMGASAPLPPNISDLERVRRWSIAGGTLVLGNKDGREQISVVVRNGTFQARRLP